MTRVYNSGVPEKVIADKSAHRSIDGLRAYEHPSMELYQAAEEVISDPTKKFSSTSGAKEAETSGVKEEPSSTINPQIPGFSGLNNCTINLSINTYNKAASS